MIQNVQKQPSRRVPIKSCSKNMQQFTEEHPCRSVISIKKVGAAALESVENLKKMIEKYLND